MAALKNKALEQALVNIKVKDKKLNEMAAATAARKIEEEGVRKKRKKVEKRDSKSKKRRKAFEKLEKKVKKAERKRF